MIMNMSANIYTKFNNMVITQYAVTATIAIKIFMDHSSEDLKIKVAMAIYTSNYAIVITTTNDRG